MTALSGTRFTLYGPSAPVPPVQVGRREVDTSVLNGFPDSEWFFGRVHSSPGAGSAALSWLPEKRVLFLRSCNLSVSRGFVMGMSGSMSITGEDGTPGVVLLCCLSWTVSALDYVGPVFSMLFVLGFGEPVVLRRVGVSLVEFSKFLQSSFREVVEGFFCPVFLFRIVEPFDEV